MLRNYLRLAFKVFARRKFFTFVSLFGITFTLVVLTVATAFLDGAFAPMSPESRQERMLVNLNAVMYGPESQMSSEGGYKLFDRYARGLPGVERLSICSSGDTVYSYVNGVKVPSTLKRTDGAFWQVFDFTFVEGGPFSPGDVDEARFVAVINETTRERFFGRDQGVGRTLEADGQRFRVVGVVRDVSQMRFVPFGDIWVPVTTAKSPGYRDQIMGGFYAIVLARDGTVLPEIRSEFASRLTRVELPDSRHYKTIVAPLESRFDAVARMSPLAERQDPDRQGWKLLFILAGLTLLFMLLPAVNLVNLNVSRIMERASEIGVRKAFGASSWTLVGQFVLENVLLTLLGGLAGLALGTVVLRVINAYSQIAYADLTVNYRVVLYGLALSVVFGVLSGVYPAWRMAKLHPVQALKGATR
jgi:putative ABC transport system permease protein